ncbi:MAG: hypothetical protein SGJ11_10365 [Phycisphaerae bacterium]|nr:hypothetical protein [Phycisphaerae bacterium]
MLPHSTYALLLAGLLLLRPAEDVDTMLAFVENAGQQMHDFGSGVTWERYTAFEDESEKRAGTLVIEGQGRERKISLLFNQYAPSKGAGDELRRHYIYGDGWVTEIDERNKSFTKRQVSEPGKDFDPLKLGEGPIPLPFGQTAAEVKAVFDVELCGPSPLPLFRSLGDTIGLCLRPKPYTPMARNADLVELFYDKTTFVLRGANMVKANGDRSSFLLVRPAVNTGLTPDQQRLLVLPNPDPREWQIDIRRWEDAGGVQVPSPGS